MMSLLAATALGPVPCGTAPAQIQAAARQSPAPDDAGGTDGCGAIAGDGDW
jgi:hypothetical protein